MPGCYKVSITDLDKHNVAVCNDVAVNLLLIYSCCGQTQTLTTWPKKSVFIRADELALYRILAKRKLVLRQLAMLRATNPVPVMVSCLDLTLPPITSTRARPATASNLSAECQKPDCQAIRQRLRKLEARVPEQPHKVYQDGVLTVKILKPW